MRVGVGGQAESDPLCGLLEIFKISICCGQTSLIPPTPSLLSSLLRVLNFQSTFSISVNENKNMKIKIKIKILLRMLN